MKNHRFLFLTALFFIIVAVSPPLYGDSPAPVNSNQSVVVPAPGASVSPAAMPAGGPEAMTDIIDIKPLVKIGYDTRILLYILYVLIAVVLVVLLIYLIDRLILKREKGKKEKTVVVPPDHMAALQLLELEKLGDMEEREYYFRLTAIVRAYIKGRFAMDALEMTSEELLPRISELALEKNLAAGLRELLKSTDPVKYAGTAAGRDKMRDDMAFARSFVDNTKAEALVNEKESVG